MKVRVSARSRLTRRRFRQFLRCLIAATLLACATSAIAEFLINSKNEIVHAGSDFAPQQSSRDGVWHLAGAASIKSAVQQHPELRSFRQVELSTNALMEILREAPLESDPDAKQQRTTLALPALDGSFTNFEIKESPILAPELGARYPEIKTYIGQGIDEPTATSRFDWTPAGFHGIVLSPHGTILIEPAAVGDIENYVVYAQSSVVVESSECDVTEQEQEAWIARNPINNKTSGVAPTVTSGTTLRTYRLAAAATAEYTQTYGNGTVSGGLSAITTTINLVDAIYEHEVAIRLTLVANNDAIIFTDPATDGYTSDNVGAMFNENQTKLDSVIGSANYDIGHVFDGHSLSGGAFSWQGQGNIGSVCVTNQKAKGVDIFRSVPPTFLYAYYSAAHEIGHQFGGTHTFNATTGTCGSQRTPSSAYEPANGSTIMGYRLACSPEDLNSQDTYFHNNSITQIVNYSTNLSSCAATAATGNNPPAVSAGSSFTIPMNTPFTLTATGSDPEGDALTFGWEEFDLGTSAPPDTDDGSRPIFRSFLPATSPSRTFPRLQDVLSGGATFGESMATTTRTMNFRVTARDNRAGGGGVNSAATQVNVRNDSGPFTVTQPATSTNWPASSLQTVTWNVASTNLSPINCANVRITLSTDGGTTFPIILANNTPNDGSETITIPGTPSGNARVRVEAVGNIFFNISRGFTINGSANTIPQISNFSPTAGSPGTSVTISGFNFISPSSVAFNGTSAAFTVNSTTEIVATVPIGASTGPITVTTPSGTATSALNFGVPTTNNTIQFSSATYTVTEGTDMDVIVIVNRTGDTSNPATVDYATSDTAGATSCGTANAGAASSRCDYLATIGTLHFAANETAKNIIIPIVDDSYNEGAETFRVTLSNTTGNGASPGAPNIATLTINDNDATTTANPIDVAGFFVRQHYVDFLNREPDQSGLTFWINGITICGNDQACIERKRIDTSAAFFLSIEFQQTGYLVYKIYKAAYGNISNAPVPIRLNEFLPDTQEIGSGVVVGQGNWQQQLETNKQAYALEFVQRTRFTSAFPTSLTPQEFVNVLFVNAAVSMQGPEYITAINEFGGAGTTADTAARSRALRDVAEHPALNQQEFNRAFVLMQYFGYLRRNPDDSPEPTLDYQGYNFWLNKLNSFGGNYLNAEMVKAFISSDEYRRRFGP